MNQVHLYLSEIVSLRFWNSECFASRAIMGSMTTEDIVAALGRTALFGGLADPELRLLAKHAVVRRLSRGDVLFVVDEEAQGMFVIVSGSVRAFRVNADGREQVLHVERAGATLAEVPVFDDGPYPATASAE